VPFYPEAQVEGTDVFNGDSATRNGRYHSVICFEAGDFDIPEEIIPDPPNPKWTRDPDSLVLLENDTWIRGYSDLDGDGFTETETAHLKLNCTLNYDRTEYICVIEESWGWKRNKDEICPYENEPQFTSAPVTTATEDVGYIYDITTSDLDVGDTLEITGTILPIPTWLFLDDNGDGTA
jgi:hypothetical protein